MHGGIVFFPLRRMMGNGRGLFSVQSLFFQLHGPAGGFQARGERENHRRREKRRGPHFRLFSAAERKERRAGESVCEIEGIPSEREEEGGRISIHASEGAWAGWIRLPIQGPGFREGFPDA